MSEKYLEAKNLSYLWHSNDLFNRQKPKTLWQIPFLHIDQPGTILLAGRNGCGKSTLLRSLVGLIKPTTGTISWFGSPSNPRGKIGYIPELPVFPARVLVSEMVSALLGFSDSEFKKQESENPALGALQVSQLFARPAHLLSKGQQQKLLLSLAIAARPQGFILDEPFSGLDPWARSELAQYLVAMGAKNHFLLISSHDAPAALRQNVRETWILENETLTVKPGCALPE